jgi:hypothetical protein
MTSNGSSITVNLTIAVGRAPWLSATGLYTDNDGIGYGSLWMQFSSGANVTGIVETTACATILWNDNSVWSRGPTPTAYTEVHIVYMTHLDVGFTNLARNVSNTVRIFSAKRR